MKVTVDASTCTGCGLCASECPDIFEVPELVAVVKVSEVPEDQKECVKQAAADCPVEAIKIQE